MRPINGQVVSSSIHLGAYFRAEHTPTPLLNFPKKFSGRDATTHTSFLFYAISAQSLEFFLHFSRFLGNIFNVLGIM